MFAHLEIQFLLEDIIQQPPVLARICLVDPIIRAHDAADPSLDGLGERPQLVFVERAIVDVGRIGLASASAAEMFLLVECATVRIISAM
jgi:hypothetical protein